MSILQTAHLEGIERGIEKGRQAERFAAAKCILAAGYKVEEITRLKSF
jgi:hypothetical protein